MYVRLRAAEVARKVGFSEDFISAVIFSADCWNECIRTAWKRDPEKTKKGLAILADDEAIDVRCAISRSKYAPAEVLEKLANDPDGLVRSSVAHNSSTPSHILTQLAKDNYYATHVALVHNPNTPLAVLTELQNNPDPYINNRAKTLNKFLHASIY